MRAVVFFASHYLCPRDLWLRVASCHAAHLRSAALVHSLTVGVSVYAGYVAETTEHVKHLTHDIAYVCANEDVLNISCNIIISLFDLTRH